MKNLEAERVKLLNKRDEVKDEGNTEEYEKNDKRN